MLFIEFRKELGFPLIEVIWANFRDASVFEQASKDYSRGYIEVEYRSSGYEARLQLKRECRYTVCCEHDWKKAAPCR